MHQFRQAQHEPSEGFKKKQCPGPVAGAVERSESHGSIGSHSTGIACTLWENKILKENLTVTFFSLQKGRFLIEEEMHKKRSSAHPEEDTSLVQKE